MNRKVLKTYREKRDEVLDRVMNVRTSEDELRKWDHQAIIRSLKTELGPVDGLWEEIAKKIELDLNRMGVETITAPLIRELVCVELLRRGMEKEYKKYQRLGVPIYDVDNIIFTHNTARSSNNPHTPETTNLTLAESIKKDYALSRIFSPSVAEAHLKGDFHLHKLDFPDRPYCCGNSLEYVKKYGLNTAASLAIAKPAKHADVLILHMIKFSCMLQVHFSGAIGWEAVNIFLAPFLVGASDHDLEALAQLLIYEFNMQNVAKGGQAVFSDINLYWEVPDHYRKTPAIGPGGKYTGKTYGDYQKESQRFLTALMKVYLKGDASERPFFWPKPNFHMTEKFWQSPGHEEFLELASTVAAEKGNTEFFFDRGSSVRISQCCRLSFKLSEAELVQTRHPERMRQASGQFISLFLPRIAYEACGSERKLFSILGKRMELAAKAHRQKHRFLSRLLEMGIEGPLSALSTKQKDDPEPYYRLKNSVYLFTIAGLNEMIQYHTGQELHQSDQALKMGLKVISFMNKKCTELAGRYKMRFALEQSPMEGTCYRIAKLDLKYFPNQASKVVKGNLNTGAVYYTNSSQLNNSVNIDPVERVYKEGLFHPLIDAGAMTHIWIGEQQPSALSIASFVKKTFYNTRNELIAFSPEFSFCGDCRKTSRGLVKKCLFCGSQDIDHATRVSGFFSLTSRWNKGKIQELEDRYRNEERF
ncbi:MAG TPA: anaerobic ribonucleoside-triphosphate reductase [Candidatus Bathyarchaeia archaeon]|nr:anaerobic ribonucleoside-triphosphate reductase [Candidatus Bathyarchaeia archaeon]